MERQQTKHICTNCRDTFLSSAHNVLYCKKPECQEAKIKNQKKNVYLSHKKSAEGIKSMKAKGNQYCIKGCGTKTANRFGVCNGCRSEILSGYNYDFYELMA